MLSALEMLFSLELIISLETYRPRDTNRHIIKTIVVYYNLNDNSFSAVFIGSSAATYSSFYWKNHILADHHLSSSFTLVILACLSFQLICIIHTVKRAPGKLPY